MAITEPSTEAATALDRPRFAIKDCTLIAIATGKCPATPGRYRHTEVHQGGFGSEAMWKGKPVIGGDTGGIRLQVINFQTGFLVNTPEGAALRIRYLFNQPKKTREMGITVKNFVRENFLLTRQLREHLTLMFALQYGSVDRIELG